MEESVWEVQGKRGKSTARSNSKSVVERRGCAALTSLKRLAEWNALLSCESAAAILETMERLESSWLTDVQHFMDVNLAFGVLKAFSYLIDKNTPGTIELLKKTLTSDLIGKIVKHLKKAKSSNIDLTSSHGEQIIKFVEFFRENLMHLLCHDRRVYDNDFTRQSFIDALDICLDFISFLYELPSNDPELVNLEMVCKFSSHSKMSKARMSYFVYPQDFKTPTDWKPIKEYGPYEDLEDYVNTHFCLLKEDFDSNLRSGVASALDNPRSKNGHVWVYPNVQLSRDPFLTYNKYVYEISFTNPRVFANVSWDTSKRFLNGSLLILTNDNFLTYHFATVESFIVTRGVPTVRACFISIPRGFGESNCLLIEPHVFFPPYFYTMMALHKMLSHGVPFKRYIVYANTEKILPTYLEKNSTYTIHNYTLEISDQQKWLTPQTLDVNESQRDAFFFCLTNEVALIQGPPGTGKTFLAVKVLQSLIQNRRYGKGPILVVCYKNYALDQILERFTATDISVLRLGSRSKNESLNTDKNIRQIRAVLPPEVKTTKRKWEAIVDKDFARVTDLTQKVNLVNAQIGIIRLDVFKKYKIISDDVSVDIVTWLLEESLGPLCKKLKRFCNNNFALSLIELTHRTKELESLHGWVRPKDLKEYHQIGEVYTVLQYLLESGRSLQSTNFSKVGLLKELNSYQRWRVYMTWQRKLVDALEEERRLAQESLLQSQKTLQEVSDFTLHKLQFANPDIVGVTTTVAARHYSALSALGAKIVLVEEAAEVLESHIVASVSAKCQHLMLIGDHQQLKPSANSSELNTGGNMDVSLFKRLINNKIEWVRLSTQHRMRPEIASLICPLIYKDLKNAPSTENHPHIRGMEKDVFFMSHVYPEQEEVDGDSKYNRFEAEMIAEVVLHLLWQEYAPDSITILCAYSAQVKVIQKALRYKMRSEEHWSSVKEVALCTVDSYQGQENDIVLLSLVRSNVKKIGFLNLANRICVSLSRARNGLFIFGNMDCLSKPPGSVWKRLQTILNSQKALNSSLPLKCMTHNTVILVSNPQDFLAVPYGGCGEICGMELDCHHTCMEQCHGFDRQHNGLFLCEQNCLLRCSYGHQCLSKCKEPCPPCYTMVFRKLKCNHVQKIRCSYGSDRKYCTHKINIELERCGHENTVACGKLFEFGESNVRCKEKLVVLLDCGHKLRYKCGTMTEEEAKKDCHEKCNRINVNCPEGHECNKRCSVPCGKCDQTMMKKLHCGHSMTVKCHESIDDIVCISPCFRSLPCGHRCRNLCSQPCGNCREMVPKRIQTCGHTIKAECCTPEEMLPDLCEEGCEKQLSCGHPCPGTCRQICGALECCTKVKFTPPCGHPVMVLCKVLQRGGLKMNLVHICKYSCDRVLPCGHLCRGTCGTCYEGKLHQPCLKRCGAVLDCKHRCQNRCSLLYHSCTDRKCVDICHKKELKALKDRADMSREKSWHKNQNIMDKINLELRQRLSQYMSDLQLDIGFLQSENYLTELITILFSRVSKSVYYKYTNACENISNVMSSLFVAEMLGIIVSVVEHVPVRDARAIQSLEDLIHMASTRENRLGSFEIEQLQQLTVWTLLHFDYYHLKSLASSRGKDFNLSDLMNVRVPKEENVSELRRLLNFYKNQLKVQDFRLTQNDKNKLFPLTTELSTPVRHHPLNAANCTSAVAHPAGAANSDIVPVHESSYTNVSTDLLGQVASIMKEKSLDKPEEEDDIFEYIRN